MVSISLKDKTLSVDLTPQEIEARLADWSERDHGYAPGRPGEVRAAVQLGQRGSGYQLRNKASGLCRVLEIADT
jgi:hypothetical protein